MSHFSLQTGHICTNNEKLKIINKILLTLNKILNFKLQSYEISLLHFMLWKTVINCGLQDPKKLEIGNHFFKSILKTTAKLCR